LPQVDVLDQLEGDFFVEVPLLHRSSSPPVLADPKEASKLTNAAFAPTESTDA
jgi:hypothetical protein